MCVSSLDDAQLRSSIRRRRWSYGWKTTCLRLTHQSIGLRVITSLLLFLQLGHLARYSVPHTASLPD